MYGLQFNWNKNHTHTKVNLIAELARMVKLPTRNFQQWTLTYYVVYHRPNINDNKNSSIFNHPYNGNYVLNFNHHGTILTEIITQIIKKHANKFGVCLQIIII